MIGRVIPWLMSSQGSRDSEGVTDGGCLPYGWERFPWNPLSQIGNASVCVQSLFFRQAAEAMVFDMARILQISGFLLVWIKTKASIRQKRRLFATAGDNLEVWFLVRLPIPT